MRRYRYEDSEDEPTFSLYDFKKWLQSNGQGEDEAAQQESAEEFHKEELKEKFKKKFREKLKKREERD